MDLQKGSERQIEQPVAPSLFELELEAPAVVEQGELHKANVSPLRESIQRFRRDLRAMISLGTLVAIFFFALIFPPIYQRIGETLNKQDLSQPGVSGLLAHQPKPQRPALAGHR